MKPELFRVYEKTLANVEAISSMELEDPDEEHVEQLPPEYEQALTKLHEITHEMHYYDETEQKYPKELWDRYTEAVQRVVDCDARRGEDRWR